MIINWKSIKWARVDSRIRRMQNRIYKASLSGEREKVYTLQRKMIYNLYAKLIAVRRVTTENRGKNMAGLDRQLYLSPEKKLKLAKSLRIDGKAAPIRRKWIPKSGKREKRPLGIPTISDRAKQKLVHLALEPQWEALFEPKSYGFRPGRSTHDAMEAIFHTHRKTPSGISDDRYIVDSDLKGCFDNIDHPYLIKKLDTIPVIKDQVKAWLKAGIFEGFYLPIERYEEIPENSSGTPQGQIVSPLLCNLHGMENNLKEWIQSQKWPTKRKLYRRDKKDSILLVRYADDFIISHPNKDIALDTKEETSRWLSETSKLSFNEGKTSIISVKNGFVFLGFSFIKIFNKQKTSYRLKIYPTKKNQKALIQKIGNICRRYRAISSYDLIRILRPIVVDWANYYRYCECKSTFNKMDHFIFRILRAWVFRRARKKGRFSVKEKYFPSGRTYVFDNRKYSDNWILYGKKRGKNGEILENFLPRLSWVKSSKHIKVPGTSSVYDRNQPSS